LALRFCHDRLNGSAFNNLAGALHTDRVGCTLSVGREVKMEIPAYRRGSRTLAVATISRDLQNLQIERAMESRQPVGLGYGASR
jgi:hypothetical protein